MSLKESGIPWNPPSPNRKRPGAARSAMRPDPSVLLCLYFLSCREDFSQIHPQMSQMTADEEQRGKKSCVPRVFHLRNLWMILFRLRPEAGLCDRRLFLALGMLPVVS